MRSGMIESYQSKSALLHLLFIKHTRCLLLPLCQPPSFTPSDCSPQLTCFILSTFSPVGTQAGGVTIHPPVSKCHQLSLRSGVHKDTSNPILPFSAPPHF